MSSASSEISSMTNTVGEFNYLNQPSIPSLYRNGEVLTRRDLDGSDGGTQGVNLTRTSMAVTDARLLPAGQHRTLAANGFELLERPLGNKIPDFFDHQQVVGDYYQQCERIVAEATGAKAFAFDHNVRSASGKKAQKRIAGGQQVQGPAHVVHGDYTLFSAPQRLRDLAQPPGVNDTLASVLAPGDTLITENMVASALQSNGRFAIINVWRNITDQPVATHPIALCDGQTVKPDDLVVFEIHYQDRIGENYFAKHADGHQWYFYSAMTRDEALLIKQWDSAGNLASTDGKQGDLSGRNHPCTFSFHSAFADPQSAPDAPDRWSIEVRCIVIYD